MDPPEWDIPDAQSESDYGSVRQSAKVIKLTPKTERPHQLLSAPAFMATFTNPDYVVDGIIQRGRLHALTSNTGHGKTAAALYIGWAVTNGSPIGSLEVEQGPVVFLEGENPDDLCGRFWAAAQAYQCAHEALPHVMPGNFPIDADTANTIRIQIDDTEIRPALIVVDSSAAYFHGDDDNQNVQMGAYARNLRVLTQCKGNPAVLVLCHPVKKAAKDNLLPRGGGAFLNEIDVNLTLWAETAETTVLHWQGKIRGADFQPLALALHQIKLRSKTDAKGRPFVSIVAKIQTDAQAEAAVGQEMSDENTVLEHLRRSPGISMKQIAVDIGWVSETGVPNKTKVQRLLRQLMDIKLARPWRGKWTITDAGKAELERGNS